MTENAVAKTDETRSEATAPESTRGGTTYTPRVDILETEDELAIFADMPGCRPEDVEVRYENGTLEIYGRCPPRQQNVEYLLDEYGVGDYYRSFSVSEEIDAGNIKATYKQGVLTVHLPKSAAVRPSRIPVQAE